jgi:hypothetical protein
MMRCWRALLLSLAIAGCSDPPTDLGDPFLTAHLTVEPLAATAGGTMTIRLMITHTGNGATIFTAFADGHSFDPMVKNAEGIVVWTANSGRQVDPTQQTITLRHMETYTASVVWALTDTSGSPLPPGSYNLMSQLEATGLALSFTQISTPITIKAAGTSAAQ